MILDTIVEYKKKEVKLLTAAGFSAPDFQVDPPRGFTRSLTDYAGVAVIAEAKKASPSKGIICPDFDPAAIARSYKEGGAQAMSVLTDEKFFSGHLDYLVKVRDTVNLPVLRKDFIVHDIQIRQAAAYGADAVLLIAAILAPSQMQDYLALSNELRLDVLVEVHDEWELEKSLKAGATLVGVNNRDLRDFSVDMETTFRIRKLLPAEIPLVSESGIRDYNDMKKLAEHGVTAALVGETLMRAPDKAVALRELRGETV